MWPLPAVAARCALLLLAVVFQARPAAAEVVEAGASAPVVTPPAGCSEEAARIEVRRFRDTESGGWAHKLDDQAFEAGAGECVVSWNVITFSERPDDLRATIHNECGGDLPASLRLHDAILCRVAATFPRQRLRRATMVGADQFSVWQERLVVASAASPEWARIAADQRRGVFHVGEPNGLYVRLFHASNVGREIVELVARYGWSLSLASVEKVFEATADSLPFADRYPALQARGTQPVITGAGMLHFTLTAHTDDQSASTPAPRLGDALVGRVADAEALGPALCGLAADLEREPDGTTALFEALGDRREVLRAHRITVRDIAFTLLERTGVIADRVDRPVKQIVGCQIGGEWYRFHIADVSESDFEQTRQHLLHGEQR